jgi:mono/diheme cytochrome c family protein
MRLAALALLLVSSASCVGCGPDDPTGRGREYVKDMIGSVAYDSFDPNPATRDHKTLQAPAPGSIPRGYEPFDYGPGPQEAVRAGRELKNPIAATPADLARGDKLFHTYCYLCHGDSGKGDGPVVPRFPQPPSLLAPHARSLPDGQIVHIITRGQGLMPSHATQVPLADRYRLALYIRKLQAGGAQ